MGRIKKDQLLVGFALESNDEINNAREKLKTKNLDAIILNSLNDKGAGFKFDTNKITFIKKNGTSKPFKLKSKSDVDKLHWKSRSICKFGFFLFVFYLFFQLVFLLKSLDVK